MRIIPGTKSQSKKTLFYILGKICKTLVVTITNENSHFASAIAGKYVMKHDPSFIDIQVRPLRQVRGIDFYYNDKSERYIYPTNRGLWVVSAY